MPKQFIPCGCGTTCSVCGQPATGTETASVLSSPDGHRVISVPTETTVVPCGDYGHIVYTICPEHA